MFKPVTPNINFPKLEEEILKYWKENKIFEKSVETKSVNKTWTFLDGPPFVTGTPHYGSLLSSIPKDLFARFWTMKGYRVKRVWGWDGHGLPIENKVENELKIKRKKDIEEIVGVKKFIEECKKYVNQVSAEWEWYVDHIGRWVDFKNAYKTWDKDYMESVMWVFKQMYDKGSIYKGLRVSLYCPHCATPISNFEVAMDAENYKDITDFATTYKYKLRDEENTYILAWSTTPWTKIVTTALAVNPKLTYVKIKQGEEYYILAKSTIKMIKDSPKWKIADEFLGKDLAGKKFISHYDYSPIGEGEKVFEIFGADFVTAEEGTGVVTIAAYGEEDLKLMHEEKIHMEMHLDEEGIIKNNVPKFAGLYYLKANKQVNEDLALRGLVYEDKEVVHSVPLCWRCHTRLYYAPLDAWFVDVQSLKPLLKKTNEKVNWFPDHFKHGRFLKSLENAPDWNISRNRYWGSPVPVWECECGERFVPGSIKELEDRSGRKINDLHKPEIDEVTVICKNCGKKVKRVPEVLDSWIEAGSASFAERHFPFNEGEKLSDFFPPDFIAEYTGQIRAWFYVLHIIGGVLYESEAFKNVMVEGVILGNDGRKMSKNYRNYPDPKMMIGTHGGDALRLYLMGSPVMKGEDILISEEQYRNQVKGMMLILWNVYNFFVNYANIDNWKSQKLEVKSQKSGNALDSWILSLLNRLIKDVTKDLNNFSTVDSVEKLKNFVDSLSNWYIRRSRDRVGFSAENEDDKNSFYGTCFKVLTEFSKILAPFAPFLSEEIYRNLTKEESVHLSNWPNFDENLIDKELELEMEKARKLASLIHALRKENGLKVRTPLKKLSYEGPEKLSKEAEKVLLSEVNVYELYFKGKKEEFQVSGDLDEKNQDLEAGLARDIMRKIQEERKKLGTAMDEKVDVVLPSWPIKFEEEIKKKALVNILKKGEELKVERIN